MSYSYPVTRKELKDIVGSKKMGALQEAIRGLIEDGKREGKLEATEEHARNLLKEVVSRASIKKALGVSEKWLKDLENRSK
jgi:chromosome segregation and condensation protein ScpB